jgi:membrane protein
LVAAAGIITGGVLLDTLVSYGVLKRDYIYNLLNLSQYLIVVFTFFFSISFIYYLAPNVTVRWNFFSIGSVIATVLTIIVSYGFSIYLNNFASYNKLYGSIGTFIGLMLWLYIMSYIILIGFEINAAIDAAKRKHDRHHPYKENS